MAVDAGLSADETDAITGTGAAPYVPPADGSEAFGTARDANDTLTSTEITQLLASAAAMVKDRQNKPIPLISADDQATYTRICETLNGERDVAHYLSTSPTLYNVIVQNLAKAGLTDPPARIIIEKPLGRDLASCNAINEALGAAFSAERASRASNATWAPR